MLSTEYESRRPLTKKTNPCDFWEFADQNESCQVKRKTENKTYINQVIEQFAFFIKFFFF